MAELERQRKRPEENQLPSLTHVHHRRAPSPALHPATRPAWAGAALELACCSIPDGLEELGAPGAQDRMEGAGDGVPDGPFGGEEACCRSWRCLGSGRARRVMAQTKATNR